MQDIVTHDRAVVSPSDNILQPSPWLKYLIQFLLTKLIESTNKAVYLFLVNNRQFDFGMHCTMFLIVSVIILVDVYSIFRLICLKLMRHLSSL